MTDPGATPGRRAALPAAVGALLFALACLLPGVGAYTGAAPADVELFRTFGERVLDGELPYRDFFVEYPPFALPAFVVPSLGPADDYVPLFKGLQILFGACTVALVALLLARLGAARGRLWLGTGFAALAPVLLGPTLLNRYDLWPALLLAGSLAALAWRRVALGLVLLALAVLAKGYAAVVVPPALLYVHALGGREALRRGAIAFVAAAAAVVAPFALFGAGGLRHSFSVQTGRGHHLESLGGSILAVLDRLGAYSAEVVTGFAYELEGSLPGAMAALATLVQVAAVALAWLLFRRGPATTARFATAAAASVAAFAAFGKVLSPQFLIWLVPLVALAGGFAAPALLLAALGLTRSFFPDRYGDVVALGGSTWLVLARNLVLVGLALALLERLRAQRE